MTDAQEKAFNAEMAAFKKRGERFTITTGEDGCPHCIPFNDAEGRKKIALDGTAKTPIKAVQG